MRGGVEERPQRTSHISLAVPECAPAPSPSRPTRKARSAARARKNPQKAAHPATNVTRQGAEGAMPSAGCCWEAPGSTLALQHMPLALSHCGGTSVS